MNDQIFEAVVTTQSPSGQPHVAPMGVRYQGGQVVLMPFRPSTTLDNILATGCAVLNRVVDGRVYAGCVTGRKQWPLQPVVVPGGAGFAGQRRGGALSHQALRLLRDDGHPQRPTLWLAVAHEAQHAPFLGLNRAQAAVLEGAVLVSRLHLLPRDKISAEMAYLRIAIDKTAGPDEHQAWGWLTDAVAQHAAAMASAPEGLPP
ncbi:MAG: tetrahydromethanopterin synthesis protein [Burkholderiales bacterium PBB5]|nr:MAG: tetrahydromethanopterin synthesis protein [Burkholderiales bacterium PBB5]